MTFSPSTRRADPAPTAPVAPSADIPGRPARSAVADLLVALMPFSVILLGYAAAQWINADLNVNPVPGATNAFGFALRMTEPVTVDRWVFGDLPTVSLQRSLHPDPSGRWLDAVAALVYSSHFVVIPVVGAVLWFRRRTLFRPWLWSVLLLTAAGIVLYVVYPMAPPWMAARDGFIEPVQRLSGLGWRVLGLDVVDAVQERSQQTGNTVAAMPSLHAGAATVVAAFFWAGAPWWGRALVALYPLTMAVVLVYTGEHYVVDVVVGAALAVLAVVVVRRFRHRRHPGVVVIAER